MKKAVALCSGGLDSITLLHLLAMHGYRPLQVISMDYGQRHRERELACAKKAAIRVDADKHHIIEMPWLGNFLSGSALTDPRMAVPDGHYAWETMKQTVVPNRNMILLSLAVGVAIAEKADVVALAIHAGDHAIYPDCRPAFFESAWRTMQLATEGFASANFRLFAPFIYRTKAEIVGEGAKMGVPFEETWSCYKGGEIHCGKCGTCVERIEAFRIAGVRDPTQYADTAFATEVTHVPHR